MDINTDLTRGRVFAGKSYVNPQTRSASLGGYYGYYHSIRNGSLDPMVTFDMLMHGGTALTYFLDYTYGDRHRGRLKRHALKVLEKGCCKFDFKGALSRACRVYNLSWYGELPNCIGPVPLGGFLKHGGDLAEAWRDDLYLNCTSDDDLLYCSKREISLQCFFRFNGPVRDYNKFFVLHGTFFFELESGNMETASGKLAYDSDETYGLIFREAIMDLDTADESRISAQDVEDANEREMAALYLYNDNAVAQTRLLEAEWVAASQLQAVSSAAQRVATGMVVNSPTPVSV